MKIDKEKTEILSSKNQLYLYGFSDYFNSFVKLFNKNELPNTILLSGLKGLGKATFAYHFINYILSSKEDFKYSSTNFSINPINKSYKNLSSNAHPNFYLLENNNSEDAIKIDNVRDVLKFVNKTTYNSNIKIVLIDNAEYLNINSTNALLKALEEPNGNTFFFLIHNSSSVISETIKSRCVEFKIFFSLSKKKNILRSLMHQHKCDFSIDQVDDNFYFESPGNIFKYLMIFNEANLEGANDNLSTLIYLIDKYKHKKDPQLFNFISLLIELFYKDLALKNKKKINIYFYNKFKVLKLINDVKKFNLDKNNFFISLQGILENES